MSAYPKQPHTQQPLGDLALSVVGLSRRNQNWCLIDSKVRTVTTSISQHLLITGELCQGWKFRDIRDGLAEKTGRTHQR